jgi:hypothetical protein
MEPGDDAGRAVKQEYARRKKRQLLVSFGVIIPAFALFVGSREFLQEHGLDERTGGAIFLILVLGVLAFSFWNWRCPSCRSYLGKAFRQRFCRSCGVQLTD